MATSTLSTAASATGALRRQNLEKQQRFWGWVFLSPWIIGFIIFTAMPMLASLYFSFTDFTIGQPINFVGLKNWQNIFVDPVTRDSIGVTLRFALLAVPVGIILPLGLATLLNSPSLYGKPILRVMFYLPYMVPTISGFYVMQAYLNGQTGWLNRILRAIGIQDPPNWLFDPKVITPALIIIGIWGIGNAMLTMLASMQGVPTELYDASKVDGANSFITWYKITLPLISPVIFYNLILGIIGVMQYFIVPYLFLNTQRSNPDTNFMNLNLYRTAFQYNQMGYASAQAWFIFLIALAITLFIFATSRRWVYYASGD